MNSDQLPQVNHTKHKHQQHQRYLGFRDPATNLRSQCMARNLSSKFYRYLNLTSKDNPLIMKTGLRPHNTMYCM